MNIAVIVGKFPLPSETFVIDQVVGLLERGHDVSIFAERPPEQNALHSSVARYDLLSRTHYIGAPRQHRRVQRVLAALRHVVASGVSIPSRLSFRAMNIAGYLRGDWSLRNYYFSLKLAETRSEFDIIYCHFGPSGVTAISLREAGMIRGKVVTVFHGSDLSSYVEAAGPDVYKELFKRGDLFLSVSNHFKQRLVSLGCPEEKIKVHHMGVDCEKLTFRSRKRPDGKPIHLISVARLVEKKGIAYGLRAVADLIESYPNMRYTVIGGGPLKEELLSLVEELNLSDHVTFLGAQPHSEVLAHLERAHILLLPSVTAEGGDQEGVPVALMEGMALGLPVVSTAHSGIPELVENHVSGILVAEGDVKALTEGISYLLEHPDIWPTLGKAAREKVEKSFNTQALDDELVRIFRTISWPTIIQALYASLLDILFAFVGRTVRKPPHKGSSRPP